MGAPEMRKEEAMADRSLIRGGRVLYIDQSHDSQQAAALLRRHNLEHSLVQVDSRTTEQREQPPILIAGEVGRLLGLTMITAYAESISKWHRRRGQR